MSEDIRLAMFTVDCAEPGELGRFYSQLFGWTVAYEDDDAVMLTRDDGPALGFGRVDDYTPPPWPDPEGRKQFHLDLAVGDFDEAQARCVELGATIPDFQPGGDRWRVLLDPAGHPFCLTHWGA
ncbi:VOC family protein [Stackebrandtia soli]|uniref:VOC family protein n=1 Tax=Stackebrandtia soli TaxID=1892856 RepID=UPI0039E7858D